MSNFSEARTRGERIDNMENARRALRSGTRISERSEAREKLADAWCRWFHRKAEQGNDPISVLPDLAAELEQRAIDAARSEILALESRLRKALGGE